MALRLVDASASSQGAQEAAMTEPLGQSTEIGGRSTRDWTRARDRRSRFSNFLAYVAGGLSSAVDTTALRGRLEHGLRELVPARSVQIRNTTEGPARPGIPPASEVIVLDVPTGQPARQANLEVAFDPACGLDDWDFQLLQTATYVAALILEIERARGGRATPSTHPPAWDRPVPLIGSSPGMRRLREQIERMAVTDFTLLIEGVSGSGKELVALQVHGLSRRRRGRFVAVNCAAVVDTLLEAELFGIEDRTATGVRGRRGKFEHADGGTLFLDEVSDLSAAAQAKLLRAIQDLAIERVGGNGMRRIDTRIVVATNRSLSELVARGRFRADLYYRLSGVEIRVPPLRERREDILELARYFLDRHRSVRQLRLSASAADALQAYAWTGNVRELERVMERAVALAPSDQLELDDLPTTLGQEWIEVLDPSLARRDTMRTWGSRYARLVLERCGHNKRRTCHVLGISYHTLQAYLRYGQTRAQTLVSSGSASAEAVAVAVRESGPARPPTRKRGRAAVSSAGSSSVGLCSRSGQATAAPGASGEQRERGGAEAFREVARSPGGPVTNGPQTCKGRRSRDES